MTEPHVDVVIPVYNVAETVESAISSIQAQTVRDVRIIVVNDGSTDATKQIVERLAAADDRVVLIDQANGGIVDALNAGLAAGRAGIVARHDGDDLASPDRFAKQLAYLRDHPDCTALSGAARHIDEAGHAFGSVARMPSPERADLNGYPQREPYLIHPFLMMRRAAVEAVGGYRYVFHAEDTDLYWRLQEVGRLVNLPDVLGDYRIHAQSITGASLVNGRISAVNSQRSGISAMRRRAGRPDIAFAKEALREYQNARSLDAIIRVACRDLDDEEATRLAVGACAKLLELAGYRPYELEIEDCTLIRETILRAMAQMKPDSRAYCKRMLSGTAARLVHQGHVSAAFHLLPSRLFPVFAARLALRSAVPPSIRRVMRQAVGRASFIK